MKVPFIEPLEARIAPAVLTIVAVDAAKNEGSTAGGLTNFQFKITLDTPEAQAVTVLATAKDGTATIADGDFSAFAQTLTIPAGTTEFFFNVPIKQDLLIEGDETFLVELSQPSVNASLGVKSATATILNDDAPRVSIVPNTLTVSESGANGTTTNISFEVKLDLVSPTDVTVRVNTKDGTAKVADGDYDAIEDLLITIPAGQLTAPVTIQVPIRQDTVDEGNENFTVELSDPSSNALLGTAVATVTIQDDDPSSLSVMDAEPVLEGVNGATSQMKFTVKLLSPATEDVTFEWLTVAGTATAGVDFTGASGTATILAGQMSVDIFVDVLGDNAGELDETLSLFVSNARLGNNPFPTTDNRGDGKIINDDVSVSLSGTGAIAEGNPAAANEPPNSTTANYMLTLSGTTTNPVIVQLEVINGTAKAGSDFTVPTTLTLTIPGDNASTQANFSIPITIDQRFEGDETFEVRIKSVTNAAVVGTDSVTTTIVNDDAMPKLKVTNRSVTEGNIAANGNAQSQIQVVVSLDAPAGDDVTFDWSTVDGTAVAGEDYLAVTPTTVTIPAGSTTATLTLTMLGDFIFEGDETFGILLGNVSSNVVLENNPGTVTILENESSALRISDASVAEGPNSKLVFTVSLPEGITASQAITFDWNAGLGTALAGVDYLANPGTVTLPAGQNSVTFEIDVLDDALMEPNETLLVAISNAQFGSGPSAIALTPADDQAVGTIINDERLVRISGPAPVVEGNFIDNPDPTPDEPATQTVRYTISLTDELGDLATSDRPVTVTIQFDEDGSTATLGEDFTLPNALTVTIPAGSTSVDFDVTVKGDLKFEADETITLKLVNPVNAAVAPTAGSASAVIINDEAPSELIIDDATITEGNAGLKVLKFVVRLTAPASEEVTFDWSTADGTALFGQDYSRVLGGTGKILAGEVMTEIEVAISGDTLQEQSETFFVNISNALFGGTTPVTIQDAQATGTIANDELLVRITGASLTEGDDGQQGNMNFVVSVSDIVGYDVTVTFEVLAGTAKAGEDYAVPVVLSAVIPANQQQVIFSVPILGDDLDEANETFSVRLLSSQNATIDPTATTATGTIVDNDARPILSIGDVTTSEGDAGGKTMTFTVSLNKKSNLPVTFLVTPTSGTATLGSDFTGSGQTLTIPAGELEVTYTVQVTGDLQFEPNETFSVLVSGATNATIGDGSATGTITNDDDAPTLSILDAAVTEGTGGSATMNFTVVLSAPSHQNVTVVASTMDGTAVAGTDYTTRSQTLTILAGQTTATFSVTIAGDSIAEASETFLVKLSSAVNAAIADDSATGTILNDDSARLSIADLTVTEGASGTKEVEVIVSLSAATQDNVTFNWAILPGATATEGVDFAPVSAPGQVTIPAGETVAKLKFTIFGDTENELDELFSIQISNAAIGASALPISDDTAVVKIQNDEIGLSVSDATVAEGDTAGAEVDLVFTISLTAASSNPVTVSYFTQDGTATSLGDAADFIALLQNATNQVTFAPGETEKQVIVKVKSDVNFDEVDTLKLILSNPVNAVITDGEGVGTITDDSDAKPALTIDDVTRVENADEATTPGKTAFKFTINLDHASDETVEVYISTVDGTAVAGSDFTGFNKQLVTFAPGEISKEITVEVLNDALFEGSEVFNVSLSDEANASVAKRVGVGTIQPDTTENAPRVQVLNQSILEGSDGRKFLNFTVQRIGESGSPITFTFRALDDTNAAAGATAGVDYVALNSTGITLLPGETSKTVQVEIIGDGLDESDETFAVELADVTGAVVDPASDGKAIGTILNDDLTVRLVQQNYQVVEGNSGQVDLVFIAQLSAVSTHDTIVTYTVENGTAQSGTDYQAPGVLSILIPAGQTTGEIRIPVLGDTTAELAETLSVTLTGATNAELATADLSATGTILNDDPALSVEDVQIAEGAAGTKVLRMRIKLDGVAVDPVTVSYATQDGTATAGQDYDAVSGSVTFQAGETEKEVEIQIKGDLSPEEAETFSLVLSSASGATILDDAGTATILDDDTVLTINDVTVLEGDNGTRTAVFTITRSTAGNFPVTVVATTMDDTAVSTGPNPDYVAKTQTISFAAGQQTATFSVVINGDLSFEAAVEQFKVLLSNASGAAIADGEGIGTINESADTLPSIQIADASVVEGNDGTRQMAFTITLSRASDFPVSFKLATADGAGANGADGTDYTGVNETFIIPAGSTTFVVNVPILGDGTDEVDEVFTATISEAKIGDATLAISDAQAVGTILNDDVIVSIAATASASESAASVPVMVMLSAPSAHDVTVTFQLANGTAVLGTDFTAPETFSVTIPAGQAGVAINVPISADTLDENDETFSVTLTGATNAELSDARTSTATIVDDDLEPVITVADVSVQEGTDVVFTVKLAGPSSKPITIFWVTEAGTASAGDGTSSGDYQHFAAAQSLTIPAGQTTATITIKTTPDAIDELNETFKLRLLESTEAPGVNPGLRATGTILANDPNTLNISDAKTVETDGETTLVFTVTRTGSNLPVTVNYSTSNGTALAGVDYTSILNGSLSFAPGETSKTISITILGDNILELDENFFVTLSNADNAEINNGFARGTIQDDEVTYSVESVSTDGFTVVEGDLPGEQFIEVKVTRTVDPGSGTLNQPGTVLYETRANPASGAIQATPGTDYTTTSGSVTFAAGETEKIVKIPILKDDIVEGTETFAFRLTNPTNGALSSTDAERVITITDDDSGDLPKVVVTDASLVEGADGATTNMVFKVKLVGADGTTPRTTGGEVKVTYSLLDGTAVAGSDYTGLTGPTATVTIPAGQSEVEIRVPILGDATDEAVETFSVQLGEARFRAPGTPESSEGLVVAVLDGTGVGSILNDDLTITLDPIEPLAEGSGENTRTFTIRIATASSHDVSIRVKSVDGTAISGANQDFFGIGDTLLTIPAGQTSATFSVTILGDIFAEADESFTLVFSDPQSALFGSATTQTVTILNDDAKPTIAIGDASIVEGDSGQLNLVFNVVLSGATREVVAVEYNTLDGTAVSSGPLVDFLAQRGVVTFDPSSADSVTKTISIPILGDTWKELTETFSVKLSNAQLGNSTTGVTVTDDTGTGEIVDDGDATLGVFVTDAKAAEGNSGSSNMTFTVQTTAPTTSTLNFKANTRFGTAKAGDFTSLTDVSGTIAAGQSSGTISVTISGDNAFEASEFFFLDLSGFGADVQPINGSGGTLTAYGVILNDDINIINSRTFEYVDTDGDLVRVKFSKGTLTVPLTGTGESTSGASADVTFAFSGNVGGRSIKAITLSDDGFEFEGVSISMTTTPQVLVTGEVLGDGMANVGRLQAANLSSDLFQITSGIGLGKIKITGNLEQVIAGSVRRPAGISSLEVGSFGADSNQNGSVVLGPIGKLQVNQDFLGNLRVIGDSFVQPIPGGGIGKINNLIIKGALKGGTSDASGRITFTGGIGKATIGEIIGGTGDFSANLASASSEFRTAINSLTILGDFQGGAGEQSALVEATRVGNVKIGRTESAGGQAIEGNLIGGAGNFSGIITANTIGSVTINGDMRGGGGDNSASIFANQTIGKTKLKGSLIGGGGSASGRMSVGTFAAGLSIEGNVEGGAGESSGVVTVNGYSKGLDVFLGNVGNLTLGTGSDPESGSLIGGSGKSSGQISVNGNLSKFVAHGDIVGGRGEASGSLTVGSSLQSVSLKSVLIKGSILGGGTQSGSVSGAVTSLLGSGFIEADRIGSVTVEGMLKSGQNLGTALAKSGGIYSDTTIASVKVGSGGNAIEGNATAAVIISAIQSIGNVTLKGDVQFLEILAGYSPATAAATPRGTLVNAGATIDSVVVDGVFRASSIVAGAFAGTDGKFGTADDVAASNGTGTPPGNQNLVSRIASIVLKSVGDPVGASGTPSYGIVAEHVQSLKVGGSAHPLSKGATNDQLEAVGPVSAKLQIFEI